MQSRQKKDATIAQMLLSRAFEPDATKRINDEKVQQRLLFLRPSSPPPSDARSARWRARAKKKDLRRKVLKPKPFSAAERRKLGLYDVPPSRQKYSVFKPLNKLWRGYMHEILGTEIYTGGEGAAAKMSSADFHGAKLEVVRSACVSRVGIKGIVVKDSKFAFEVITEKDKLKLVPKEGTVFRFKIPKPTSDTENDSDSDSDNEEEKTAAKQDQLKKNMVVEIHGEQFQYRPADRSNKKFRSHFSEIL